MIYIFTGIGVGWGVKHTNLFDAWKSNMFVLDGKIYLLYLRWVFYFQKSLQYEKIFGLIVYTENA